MMINKNSLSLPVTSDHDVFTLKKGRAKRVFLLLHGYLLDGKYILETLKDSLPDNCLMIAPNGPFVVPVKKKDQYFPKYAWYFFDSNTKTYYIDFLPGANYIKSILSEYNKENLPVTVIGYSQGGYFAPKVPELDSNIDTVIGLACCFRSERFVFQENVTYHQIHGADDIVVESSGAIEEFELLKNQGNSGEFNLLESTAHRIDENMLNTLQRMF